MANAKRGKKHEPPAEKSSGASKPISFHPVPFEEALDALLATPPPPKDEPKKSAKKAKAPSR